MYKNRHKKPMGSGQACQSAGVVQINTLSLYFDHHRVLKRSHTNISSMRRSNSVTDKTGGQNVSQHLLKQGLRNTLR